MVIKIKGWSRLLLMAGVFIVGTSFSFLAVASCSLRPDGIADQNNGFILSMGVGPQPSTIIMPKDIAVGSEIYRMTVRNNQYYYYRIGCDTITTPSNYYVRAQFSGGSEPPRAHYQQSPGLGIVYKTSVNGIGVSYLMGSTNKKIGDKIYSQGDCRYGPTNYSCNILASDGEITYVFIKTSELTDNSINLSQVANIEVIVGGESEPGSEMVVFRPSLTGNITFTQATCTLAEDSKTVNLGKYKVSDFTATTPTTAWVDASINLTNCNYGGAQSYQYNILQSTWWSTAVTTIKNPNTAKATWNLTLVPANGIVDILDSTNGIMAIANGMDSATGVGIQLSTTNTTTPSPVKFAPQFMTGEMVSGTNAIMKIPLYARYIKTGDITGGKANGKIIYRLEYK